VGSDIYNVDINGVKRYYIIGKCRISKKRVMFNWLRHAFGGGSHTEAPPIPARAPVKPTTTPPAPKPAPEKRVDTPTENVQDRFILKKVRACICV